MALEAWARGHVTLLWPGSACGIQEGARHKLHSDSMHTPHDLPLPGLLHPDLQIDVAVKLGPS